MNNVNLCRELSGLLLEDRGESGLKGKMGLYKIIYKPILIYKPNHSETS